ncbi:MAG: YraN family protein [Clostridiales bacterium]|nr:YraN family protein [Clostridiales bacterium]
MTGENRRAIGAKQEQRAKEYLEAQGMKILEQNFRCRIGEIDLIGKDQGYLVFVEVKYRSSAKAGHPAEAVNLAKQRKICRTADFYRYCKKISADSRIRYDVLALTERKIIWYKNAFEHIG